MIKERLIDLEEKQLNLIKKILKCSIPGKTVWAYGSRVTWKANERSDLDLAVFGCDSRQIFYLKEAFEESNLLISVDVMDWEKIPEKFKTNIKEKYVVLQEQTLEKNKIQIQLSREHGRYIKDVEKCFSGLNVKVESGYVRKSIEELPMQIFIFLAGAVTSGATYDLLKAGIKKALKKFRKAEISIEDKNQNTYNISSKGQMNIFLNSNRKTKVISNIKTIDDLFKHLQAQTGAWQKVKLGDIGIEIIDGDRGVNYPKKRDFFNRGYCLFLNTKNVTDQGFLFSEVNFITEEKDKMLRKGKIRRNDVILTTRGTVGNVAFYNKKIPFQNIRINSGMVIIRPNGINPQFSHQLFKYLKKDFLNFASGSAQPQLPIRDMKNIPVQLPPLQEQKTIAETLSSLDDKIELLHEQNKTLEDTAQTLFRKWFIEDAKDEWEEGKLGDFLERIESGSRPKGGIDPNLKEGVPSIGAESVNGIGSFDFSKTKYISADFFKNMKKGIIKDYDVLIYKDGAYIGKKAMFGQGFPFEKMSVNEHIFILRANSKTNQFFIYFLLNQQELSKLNANSAQPGLNQQAMKSFKIIMPPKNRMNRFGNITKPWIEKILFNSNQIRELEKLRNTLLPQLMTGKVRLKCLH